MTKHQSDGEGLSPLVMAAADRVLCCCRDVRIELEGWLENFQETCPTPLWWSVPETGEINNTEFYPYSVDPECIPNLDDPICQLRFPDGQKAGVLMTYWSGMLELVAAAVDVQHAVISLPSHSFDAMPALICHDLDGNRALAELMATRIVQTTPYIFSCLEGRLAAQLPLRVVARYYDRHLAPPS